MESSAPLFDKSDNNSNCDLMAGLHAFHVNVSGKPSVGFKYCMSNT